MAHPPEIRQKLRSLYVHKGMGLEQAAQKLGIAPRTATRWKQDAEARGDDWDRARAASMLAGEGAEAVGQIVLEGFLRLFQSTMTELKDGELEPLEKAEAISRLADAYTKTTKAIQRSAPELNRLAVASEVLQLLGKFVRERFPQHSGPLLEVLEPFGEELVGLYG
jgi:transposase-like protein